MSRLSFHSPSGTAQIPGTEYLHARSLLYDLVLGVLQPLTHRPRLLRFIATDHPLRTLPGDELFADWRWASDFGTCFRTGDGTYGTPLLSYRDRPFRPFDLAFNTAVVLGSAELQLAARLAGHGDVHAWVDGPDRTWLAGLIDRALQRGVLRAGIWPTDPSGIPQAWYPSGWDELATWLRARADEPVVTSYSVSDTFPSPEPLGYADHEAFWNLEEAERWEHGLTWIRTRPGLQIAPEFLALTIPPGISAFDLIADDAETRLDRLYRPEDPA